jgi:L-cysteine S-thiosulfotransferase
MASSPEGRGEQVRRPGRANRRDGPGPQLLLALLLGACATPDRPPLAPAGDPARGREVFVSREAGHCILCHRAPGIEPAGNVGPPLGGIGARLTASELRVRVADITRVYPDSVMPTFHRTEGLKRVSKAYEGKPVLSAQQVEDVVAWLGTLR